MIGIKESARRTKERSIVILLALFVAIITLILCRVTVDGAVGEESNMDYVSPTPINTIVPNFNHGPSDNKTLTIEDLAKAQKAIKDISGGVNTEANMQEMTPVNMMNIFLLVIICMTAYRGIQIFEKIRKRILKHEQN